VIRRWWAACRWLSDVFAVCQCRRQVPVLTSLVTFRVMSMTSTLTSSTSRPVVTNLQVTLSLSCLRCRSRTWIKEEYHHCDKKLARLLFRLCVMPHLLSAQRTMSVINRLRRSYSVFNNVWGVTMLTTLVLSRRSPTGSRNNSWTFFSTFLKPGYLPRGRLGRIWMRQRNQRCQLLCTGDVLY